MIRIFAYNRHSESARALAAEMDVYLIRHENSRYRPKNRHCVINWGRGRDWSPARTLNHPDRVAIAVDKLAFFRWMSVWHDANDDPLEGSLPRIPEWTTEIETARSWARDGRRVVVRRILNGHEGRGIEIHTEADAIPQAPLYTRYIPKDGEFRVHIVGGSIIDLQKKVLRRDVDRQGVNRQIRNTANGYVFARDGFETPEDIKTQALLAVRASGLDFAAADVIWNERRQQAFVLELNTAPGIVGTTVRNYATALRSYIEQTN